MMKRFSLLSLIYAAACGCGPQRAADTPAAMKTALQHLIGSSREEATRAMEKAGYRVGVMTSGAFSEEGVVRRRIDYLYCDCSEGLLIERRWQVALVYVGDSITEVLVAMGLTGP
jgi:hypothetical protein